MLQNYLKTILRNFFKHKWYTGINLLGLALGFAAFILICIYLHYQTSFENFHTKADRIFRPTYQTQVGQEFNVQWARVPVNYINELPADIPEIEALIRFQNQDRKYVRIGTEKFRPSHAYVTDKEVFDVFDFKLIAGDPATALGRPYSVVLTEHLAKKYFGNDNALGREIYINSSFASEEIGYEVTGVMADLPGNTHLPVEMLLSFKDETERQGWAYIYILLKEGASVEAVEAKMPQFIADHVEDASANQIGFEFQPLKSIHLHSHLAREIIPNGNALYIRLFLWVAVFVLAIALINFINLSIALAMGRSKEFGVRKILGSLRRHHFIYTLTESIGYNLLALMLGVGLAYWLFPIFHQLTEVEMNVELLPFSVFLILIAIVSGILASIYPATVLNALKLSTLVKSPRTLSVSNFSINIRRLLLGVQFCASILLMVGALAGYQQLQYWQQKNLGLKKEQIMALPALPDAVTADYRTFKEQAKQIKGVKTVAACMQTPSEEIRDSGPVLIKGVNDDPEQAPVLDVQVIDADFIDIMDIELIAGHVPNHEFVLKPIPEFTADFTVVDYINGQPRTYLINETAMKQLGWQSAEEALGREISWSIGGFKLAMGPITGVVKDFHQESLKNKIDPLVLIFDPIWLRTFLLEVETAQMATTLQEVGKVWDETFPKYPFEYYFLNDLFNQLYHSERAQIQLLSWFSLLSVLIAAFGLFGLVAFNLRTRVKEIAIRRVLGADHSDLIKLFGKSYLLILLASGCIALPISYWGIQQWLQNFAYQMTVTPLVLLIPLGAVVFAMFIIVSVQTLRTAAANPAGVLSEE